MTIDKAIILVKNAVKESHIKGQKHVDLSLCTADVRPLAQEALMFLHAEVANGKMSDEELKIKLGLI